MLTGPYYGDELCEKDQLEATDLGADVSFESAYPSEEKKRIPPELSVSHANDWLRLYLPCVWFTTLQKTGYDSWGLWWGKTVQARSGVGWFIVVFKCWCTYHSHIIFVFEYCCFVDPEMNTMKWLLAEEVILHKENVPSKTLVESKFNIQHTPLSLKVYIWLFVFAVVSSWNMHWNTCTYCNWWRDPGAKLSTCHVPNYVDVSYSCTTGAIQCYFESQREVGERWLILTGRGGFFSKANTGGSDLRVSYACTSLFVNTTDIINLYLSFMCAGQKWSMMGKRIRIRGSGNYPWTVCQRNQINVLNKAPLQ